MCRLYLRRGSGARMGRFVRLQFPQWRQLLDRQRRRLHQHQRRPTQASSGGGISGDVCFYDGANFTGARFCMDQGQMTPNLNRTGWNNRISSIRNPDGLRVTVCDDAGYDDCRTYRTSARSLGSLNNAISSIRIR